MLEIRFHGRGGQGAKTASQLLAVAFLDAGRYPQAFPEYGPERSGAPMMAYTRIDEQPIRLHAAIIAPDVVVVLDPALIREQNVTEGLDSQGLLIVNTGRSDPTISLSDVEGSVLMVPADEIAQKAGAKHANTVMVGVLAALLGEPSVDQLVTAVDEVMALLPESARDHNRKSVQAGYTYGVSALRVLDDTREERRVQSGLQSSSAAVAVEGTPFARPGAMIRPDDYPVPLTGGWRMGKKPAVHLDRCVNCLLCWQFCPDGAVIIQGNMFLGFDYDFCKGCEICDAVCPTQAVHMVSETTKVGAWGELKEVPTS